MPPDVLLDTNPIPKSIPFRIFSGALSPIDSGDGKLRLRTIASSSVEDRGGDVVTPQAIQQMAASARGMTIFRNHSYKVPGDILGKVERAEAKHAGTDGNGKPIYDLLFDVEVFEGNPENVQTYDAVKSGVQLGTSIGAMIPAGSAKRNDGGGFTYDRLDLLEASIVGIPQNPRSWVQYATKALKTVLATPEEEEDTNAGFNVPADEVDGDAVAVESAVAAESIDAVKETPAMTIDPESGEVVPDVAAEADPELKDAKVWVNDDKGKPHIVVDTDTPAEPEAAAKPAAKTKKSADEADSDDEEEADKPDSDADVEPNEDLDPEPPVVKAGVEEVPAQEPDESSPESAGVPDGDELLPGDIMSRSAAVLADMLKAASRDLVTLRGQVTDLTKQRDTAVEQANEAQENLAFAMETLRLIVNTPLGRKAVVREQVYDLSGRLSGIYSPGVLKMLETNADD